MTQKEDRLKHRRKLSATEKLLKVRELKAQGKTQEQVAEELEISRRTVCKYWNSKNKLSYQQAIALKRQQDKAVVLASLRPDKQSIKDQLPKYPSPAARTRDRNLGVTPEQYDKLFIEQEGKCAICGRHQDELKAELSIDHCHKTNQLRGLLCNKCNLGLGSFNDNVEFLASAITYLHTPREIDPARVQYFGMSL